ncbi:hypothetical protein [Bradyrhizobium roseum]|uniref:hypothetical protein n=1 Tax=Bradyrhizobium roseum TaxID=3056648 RepID=UPI0026328A26|nr:hypothetical protein [Bradyrhizobium roseus]WKA29611.1 hypothetical protein QUH67_05345 [Bradyrhizobium roseus]
MGSIEDADMLVFIAAVPERATSDETEAFFDAMPIVELASMWAELQRPGQRAQNGAVWPAVLYFDRLPHRQPDRALDLVREVLRSQLDKRDDQFMRSLLYAYGVAAIGQIGGASQTRAPDELKARLDPLVGQDG